MHETNTFSRVKTDMALIRRRDFHLENEIPQAFRGTRSALGATFEAADKYGWTLVHPVSANPNHAVRCMSGRREQTIATRNPAGMAPWLDAALARPAAAPNGCGRRSRRGVVGSPW
jgi:hypothetical protein